MCGLTHSIFVSVPAIVIRLDMSNMAEGEWCAHKETVARRIISASNTPQMFCLTVISPLGIQGILHHRSLFPAPLVRQFWARMWKRKPRKEKSLERSLDTPGKRKY